MSLTRKIAGHTSIHVAGKLLGNIIGVIVVGLLTRYLGQEGFGNYTTILAYLFFFSSLADLGLYMITINEINKKGIDKTRFFGAVYSMRFFSGVLLMIAASLSVWLLPYPDIVKQGVVIISLSIFVSLLDQIQIAYYQAKLSMVRSAVADVIGKIVLVVGVVIGIKLGVSLLQLLWVVVLGHTIQFAINLVGIRKVFPFNITIDREYWKNIIHKTWPIALSQIFVLIYFKMDTVFLSLLRPAETAQIEVGLYGAPYKFLEVLIAFVPLFMGLIAPILAHAWSEKNLKHFKEMYQQVFDVFALFTLPLVIGGIVLATPLMNLIAPGFAGSDTILQILMLAIGVIFFAHLPTYVVNTINQQRQMLSQYGFIALLALILYIALIPLYSIQAAAWITVVIEFLTLYLAWRKVHSITKQRIDWTVFFKALLASVVMGGVLLLLQSFNIFLLLAIGAVVYGLVIIISRAVSVNTIKELISYRSSASDS